MHYFLPYYFFAFSLILSFYWEKYQTLKTVFELISKYLKLRQKYSGKCLLFKSVLGVWKCGETRSFVFDMLHPVVLLSLIRNFEAFCEIKILLQLGHALLSFFLFLLQLYTCSLGNTYEHNIKRLQRMQKEALWLITFFSKFDAMLVHYLLNLTF